MPSHKVFGRICLYKEIQNGRRFRLRDRIQLSQHPLKITYISCRADYHLLCISSQAMQLAKNVIDMCWKQNMEFIECESQRSVPLLRLMLLFGVSGSFNCFFNYLFIYLFIYKYFSSEKLVYFTQRTIKFFPRKVSLVFKILTLSKGTVVHGY